MPHPPATSAPPPKTSAARVPPAVSADAPPPSAPGVATKFPTPRRSRHGLERRCDDRGWVHDRHNRLETAARCVCCCRWECVLVGWISGSVICSVTGSVGGSVVGSVVGMVVGSVVGSVVSSVVCTVVATVVGSVVCTVVATVVGSVPVGRSGRGQTGLDTISSVAASSDSEYGPSILAPKSVSLRRAAVNAWAR